MTKPWSQGGKIPEPERWPEWKAAARNYLTVLLFVALGLWISGFRCARYLAHRPDPAIALEVKRSAALRDSIEQLHAEKDSLGIVVVVLQAHLAVDSARAAALHREAQRRDEGLLIDTTVAAVALLPAEDTGSSLRALPPDTVRFSDVQRPNDDRHYAVPTFFAASYLSMRADRNGLLIMAHDQQEVIQGLLAKAAVSDSLALASDSLNASLTRQVDVLQRAGHPRCGFRCGALTTLGLLTAGAIVLHEVR